MGYVVLFHNIYNVKRLMNGLNDNDINVAGTPASPGGRLHVHAFDFDGTLTRKDTLIEFIRFAKGEQELWRSLLVHLHLLVAMKLGLYDNGKAKERVFAYCFKGMSEAGFNDVCRRFATAKARLLRKDGMAHVDSLRAQQGTKVMIVTASIDRWVAPFFADRPDIEVLGTRVEVRDGVLTGRFSTPNCYGEEKVRRIKELFPDRRAYHLTAYGDSGGDCPMLDYANEGYYKRFEK